MLRLHDIGADVRLWQKFLIAQGFPLPQFGPDGQFGNETAEATRGFQSRAGVPPSGLLDGRTLDAAETLGFVPQDHDARPAPSDPATQGLAFPPRPDGLDAPTVAQQQERFGPLEFRMAEDREHPGRIVITNRFEEEKLVTVRLPQLADMIGAPASLSIAWNRLAAPQLQGLWSAWEAAGLLDRVKTWEGAFVPRCVRGSPGDLSNHAFGAAFDINYPWNPLGESPALAGVRGSVRELVAIANRFGFFWGGHYRRRLDGNHFEAARVMTEQQVADVLASGDFAARPAADRVPRAPAAAAYRPASAALPLLGAIAELIPQARPVDRGFRRPPRFVGVLPAGQLYFDSELALDTDGATGLSGDATHQSQTSLRYRGGASLDANRVPYFVLPLPTSWPGQFGIGLGDLAAVIFGGRVAFAAFADFGPKTNLGEGSLELFRQLGQERVRPNGSVRDVGMGPGIITIVFPKSRVAADLEDQDALLSALGERGPDLFRELGGVLPMV